MSTKAKTPKILRVRFHKPVPAPTSATRHRPERNELDLKDVPDGFRLGQYGVSYAAGKTAFLVPWADVRYCEIEAPKTAKPKTPREDPAASSAEGAAA